MAASAQTNTAGQAQTPDVTLAYEVLGSDTSLPPVFALNEEPEEYLRVLMAFLGQ